MAKIPSNEVPQANSLSTVADLLAVIDVGIEDKQGLVNQLRLVPREVDYYKQAARILGFARKRGKRFEISEQGHAFLKVTTPEEKQYILSNAVRDVEVFKTFLRQHDPLKLEKAHVVEFLREHTDVGGATIGRRASTILAWLKAIS
jgi:hypothetical protein